MYYKYSVLSETGNEINGVEEGSRLEIKNRLLQKKFYILSLELDIFTSIKAVAKKKKIKSRMLSGFFYDLSNMLKTGISVHEGIILLKESSGESALAETLSQINEDLANGFSLTAAFQNADCFPGMVLTMLKVGEKSGDLERVFKDLAAYYSRQAEFTLNLKNAAIYPLIVFCLLIGIMFYVSFKVIPHLEGLLPVKENAYFATRLLLFFSGFLRKFWGVFLMFPLLLLFLHARLKQSPVERTDSFYYRIPVIGQLVKDITCSAFFANLAVLQRNGIGIADSLALICQTTQQNFFGNKILKLKDLILSGLSLWQALEKDSFFPRNVYRAVRTGEEMGRLDEYLERLAEDFSDKVNREVRALLNLLQPLLLALCAAFLMLIVLAFIVPIYSNLSNIAGGNVKF